MIEEELTQYVEHLRGKLDDETFTEEDAFNQIWSTENDLSHQQKEQIHQALELSSPFPSALDFFVTQSMGKKCP
jgi:hypothetical protein